MFVHTHCVGPLGTNCYLFGDETTGAAALVDPGGDAPKLLAAAEAAGVRVEKILLTHGHFDHTGAVEKLRAALGGIGVWLHAADRKMLGTSPVFPALGATVDYGEGDTLAVGPLTVKVLHTPGHTPGSVTLEVEDVLFTGDTLFAGSMGRTDFQGGDGEAMMASLRRLGALEGERRVLPGHMEETTLSRERACNPCLLAALRGDH